MAQTLDQIITDISNQILANFAPVLADTRVGTVMYEAIINPMANEVLSLEQSIDTVTLNQSIDNAAAMTGPAMDALAANFGVTRFFGLPSVGYERFVKFASPTSTVPIPAGSIVATQQTNSSPASTFVTLSAASLLPSSPPDPISGAAAYVDILVQAQAVGSSGNVASGTVINLITPIAGVDRVYNPNAFNNGSDSQSNTVLAQVVSADSQGELGTRPGYKKLVLENFSVQDILVLGNGDPGMLRSQYGGSVDIVILGNSNISNSQSYPYTGQTTLVPSSLPLVSVQSLSGFTSGAVPVTFIGPAGGIGLGLDYDVILDTTGPYAGSFEENSKIVLHFVSATPGIGTNLTLAYTYNQLVDEIQSFMSADANDVLGSDVLVRAGVEIDAAVTANISVIPGYDPATVLAAATTSVQTFSNNLLLGVDVEPSQVITAIENTAGVDFVDLPSFILALLATPSTPVQQIVATNEQFIRIPSITIAQL